VEAQHHVAGGGVNGHALEGAVKLIQAPGGGRGPGGGPRAGSGPSGAPAHGARKRAAGGGGAVARAGAICTGPASDLGGPTPHPLITAPHGLLPPPLLAAPPLGPAPPPLPLLLLPRTAPPPLPLRWDPPTGIPGAVFRGGWGL
jgi:hypothetical protein